MSPTRETQQTSGEQATAAHADEEQQGVLTDEEFAAAKAKLLGL